MGIDFFNFLVLYMILTLMFSTMGSSYFVFYLKEFESFFSAVLTVLDISISNFNFDMFEHIQSEQSSYLIHFGELYTMAIVISVYIMVLNLIISILANTYRMFDTKSSGLYLSKILNARGEMSFDENYGAFMLDVAPVNIIIFPFVPYAIMKKPTPRFNNMLTVVQYASYIVVVYMVFLILSLAILPFAYLVPLRIKLKNLLMANNARDRVITFGHLLFYAVTGLPMLVASIFSDFYYFWANNFRSNLKKIIVGRT